MLQSKLYLLLHCLFIMISSLSAQLKCDYCNLEISGKYLTTAGKSYHDNCYTDHIQARCQYCKKPIDGPYNVHEDKSYHEDCYIDHIVPKCDICRLPLKGSYITDFWGTAFHEHHSEEFPECSSCGRLISDELTGGGYDLGDGRNLCGICNETSVSDDYLIESALNQVKRLLASNGINDFPKHIPISIVDKTELKQKSTSYSDAMQGFTDHNTQTRNGEVILKESHIYILSHLPMLMFKAVLAHELLHIYLFEQDLNLRPDIREGFCNLGSELVYESDNSQYSKFRLQSMLESLDPDYGIGYRKMSKLLYQKGWMYILEELDNIR
ncbi:protein DA1 [bacterium]|nr:protein DA1 [bacterium]